MINSSEKDFHFLFFKLNVRASCSHAGAQSLDFRLFIYGHIFKHILLPSLWGLRVRNCKVMFENQIQFIFPY